MHALFLLFHMALQPVSVIIVNAQVTAGKSDKSLVWPSEMHYNLLYVVALL